MVSKHILFCVIGRTGSGKTTIVNELCKKLKLKCLKSYTTRSPRPGEAEKSTDHIFISEAEAENLLVNDSNVAAYAERMNYRSFATKDQLAECDFYVINPSGYEELKQKCSDMDIEFVSIYVVAPRRIMFQRAKKRGDNMDFYNRNYMKEEEEFSKWTKAESWDCIIFNGKDVSAAVDKAAEFVKEKLK